MSGHTHEVRGIFVESGVSAFTEQGFCLVEIHDVEHKVVGTAQMTPEEVRGMALNWLTAADAAESDAGVWAVLKAADVAEGTRAGFLKSLREQRNPAGDL